MSNILQCHSRGGRRFSALYAKITIKGKQDTIERFYQNAKRDSNGNIAGKGKPVSYFICPYSDITFSSEALTDFYYAMWVHYFAENPQLFGFIQNYDGFVDIFAGKSVNNQARAIKRIRYDLGGLVREIQKSEWAKLSGFAQDLK